MSTFIRYINIVFLMGMLVSLNYTYRPFLKLKMLEIRHRYNLTNIVIDFFIYLFPPESGNILEPNEILSGFGPISNHVDDPFEAYQTVLRIPTLKIKGQIFTGYSPDALNKGFWHYPGSGDFRSGGNIVIIGHRYLKLPPAQDTFYNLDKIDIGDIIYLENDLGKWSYIVVQKRVVSKSETWVLYNKDADLTLITCHPLWSSENRLVVFAKEVDKGIQVR